MSRKKESLTKCPECGGQDFEFAFRDIHTIKHLRERKPINLYCYTCYEEIRWYPRTGEITERRK